ncbi:MAG: DUF4058 family protein [Chloroflexi bacterium]|nr:DUF4058 family protein [Chloroflexota bacterium]
MSQSPFPGMDPYLEDPLMWEDFHASLALEIRDRLAPGLRPHYIAAVFPRTTYEEIFIASKPQTMIPDVGVIYPRRLRETSVQGYTPISPPPILGTVAQEVPVKLFTVEIKQVGTNRLVTAIEILSPVNKRKGHQAYRDYQDKRRDLARGRVHLLEIDLLRNGERFPIVEPELPHAPYFIFLQRASTTTVEIWPLSLTESIPIVPVPLLDPDPDIPLDIGGAIHAIYDRAAYDLRLDYSQPAPLPELPAAALKLLDNHREQ